MAVGKCTFCSQTFAPNTVIHSWRWGSSAAPQPPYTEQQFLMLQGRRVQEEDFARTIIPRVHNPRVCNCDYGCMRGALPSLRNLPSSRSESMHSNSQFLARAHPFLLDSFQYLHNLWILASELQFRTKVHFKLEGKCGVWFSAVCGLQLNDVMKAALRAVGP